jgi:membrane protease YdiL (CAAX protease family)
MVALLFVRARGLAPAFYPGWISLLPGLFAQAGIAEEVLFRGYLFGHIRVGRTFWRAAAVSMLPFVTVHLVLFFSMPWSIALASRSPRDGHSASHWHISSNWEGTRSGLLPFCTS